MNWIEAPTTIWGTAGYAVALAVASVILAFLVIFGGRLALAPARLYWEQHKRADHLEAELVAAKAAKNASDDGPNWPIHSLFEHIDPKNYLSPADDGTPGDRWDQIGNTIRDQAALGRLRVFGRPTSSGPDGVLGQRSAMRLIESNYWTAAFFTYSFFDETSGDAPHTYLEYGHSGAEYTDLHVNRAEALQIWP